MCTGLLTCETTEIRTPFVARVLRFAGNTPYIVRRGHHKDHARAGGALSSFPGREIFPKSGDFAGKPVLRHRSTERNGSAARSLPFGLRSARPEDAYPSDKSAVLEASSAKIRSARLRRGWAMLHMAKAQGEEDCRAGQHMVKAAGTVTRDAVVGRRKHAFRVLGHHSSRV